MPQQQDQFDALAKRFGGTATQNLDALAAQQSTGPARAEDFMDPSPIQGSAAGRFLSNAGEVLNPLTMLQGLFSAVRHPIDTVGNIASQQMDQGSKAIDMAKQGRYSEMAGHGAAAVLPLLGPAAAQAGEQIGAGDIAGGLGRSLGILAPFGAAKGVKAVGKLVPEGVASKLEAGASGRIADVMSPKVGANKQRFGNQAEKVAPEIAKDLAKDGAPFTREGLHGQVQSSLAAAEQGLDDAANARLSARTFDTKPIIDALLEKRKRLTAEAVEGSRLPKTEMPPADPTSFAPIGKDVVPGPNAGRVAEIDRAISEVQQLGPAATYESIRRIREAYDGPAKAVYSPSMTADYLKAQGNKMGAADVTGVLREKLAQFDPETAAANATYSIYKTADDVLEATREIERTRPRVGRAIMARLSGTIFGGQAAGPAGAAAGYVAGPVVDSLLASGATTKLKTAALMTRLAQAIRGGDTAAVDAALSQIKRLSAQGATLSVTNPSAPQMQPAPASGRQP